MTHDPDLVERLAALSGFADVPREEIAWLAEHGEVELHPAGTLIAPKGERIRHLWILLSGRMAIRVDRGAGPRQVMQWCPGDITGMLPYSRMTGPPGDNRIEETAELLAIHESLFRDMIHRCPVFTARTVHLMLDRARNFNTSDLHDEKMISLGRLAAGLAHELNNPASAIMRGAKLLRAGLAASATTARALGALDWSASELEAIERLRLDCEASSDGPVLSPLERADREDEIAAWLEAHGCAAAHATALAETAATVKALDELAAVIRGPELDTVIAGMAARCATDSLSADIERAATRIHDLVAAIKRFTQMDHLAAADAVDVAAGLRDTLRIVQAKAKEKNAGVGLKLEDALPPVNANAGELNQVWLNLLDNALDAIKKGGRIEIEARSRGDSVEVHVVDDGAGIPPEVMPRIFDPFFTTKPPGEGTGLGLDISRRLVRRYGGEITVESWSGRTEFVVRLPIADSIP